MNWCPNLHRAFHGRRREDVPGLRGVRRRFSFQTCDEELRLDREARERREKKQQDT